MHARTHTHTRTHTRTHTQHTHAHTHTHTHTHTYTTLTITAYFINFIQDFDKGVLFNMTTDADSFEIKLFDPISQRHLQAMSIPNCAVGGLALVDSNDQERNNSTFRVTKEVINRHVACC